MVAGTTDKRRVAAGQLPPTFLPFGAPILKLDTSLLFIGSREEHATVAENLTGSRFTAFQVT